MMQQGYIQLCSANWRTITLLLPDPGSMNGCRGTMHGVTRPTVGHGPDRNDHTQSVFATGLLVVQYRQLAEVIATTYRMMRCGDLQQLSGLCSL